VFTVASQLQFEGHSIQCFAPSDTIFIKLNPSANYDNIIIFFLLPLLMDHIKTSLSL